MYGIRGEKYGSEAADKKEVDQFWRKLDFSPSMRSRLCRLSPQLILFQFFAETPLFSALFSDSYYCRSFRKYLPNTSFYYHPVRSFEPIPTGSPPHPGLAASASVDWQCVCVCCWVCAGPRVTLSELDVFSIYFRIQGALISEAPKSPPEVPYILDSGRSGETTMANFDLSLTILF